MMHRPIAEQGTVPEAVMNGYFNYFAVPTNSRAINSFLRACHLALASQRLRRRSQNGRLHVGANGPLDRSLAAARAILTSTPRSCGLAS